MASGMQSAVDNASATRAIISARILPAAGTKYFCLNTETPPPRIVSSSV